MEVCRNDDIGLLFVHHVWKIKMNGIVWKWLFSFDNKSVMENERKCMEMNV